MKRFFSPIFVILLVVAVLLLSVTDSSATYRDKTVLILNSYRADVDWSRRISDSIARQLQTKYPNINIATKYLNADVVPYNSTRSLILRSIMWSISNARDTMNVESLAVSTIYSDSFQPDAFVIIGEDAFSLIHLQRWSYNRWIHVPVVLCGVDNFVSDQYWDSGKDIDMDRLIPIEDMRYIRDTIPVSLVPKLKIEGLDTFEQVRLEDGQEVKLWNTTLNITGVKMPVSVEQNLDMILKFHPNVKEIVWVDNDYYKSEYVLNVVQELIKQRYGGLKFSAMIDNRINTDSIYNEMLRSVPDRVFLTYSWGIDAMYSYRSQVQVDSMFTNYFSTPFYSLSQMNADNSYFTGGYYADAGECARKTVAIIDRIFNGEQASHIPFDSVTHAQYIFNQKVLVKHDLLEQARLIDGAIYENIPPTFYQKYERTIWFYIIVAVIVIGVVFIYFRHRRYCRVIENDTERFRRLYTKIQTIYGNASIDFAFYDWQGECVMWVVDGKKNQVSGVGVSLLNCNLFKNPNFEPQQILHLHESQDSLITNQVSIGKDFYRLIAKGVHFEDYTSVAYMVVVTDINKIVAERDERLLYEQMFEFVSDFSKIGVACFAGGESAGGSATEYWYTNLNESEAISKPPVYSSVCKDDRLALAGFWNRTLEHSQTDRFSRDIRVMGEDGMLHWVRQNIFANLKGDGQIIEINLNIDSQKRVENQLIQAKAQAEESERKIMEFLENISHEIRTPLNSIIGFSSIIAAGSDLDQDEMFKEVVRENQVIFKSLLDNIVNLSRIDSNKVVFSNEDIDVNEMFRELAQFTADYIGDKPVNLLIVGAPTGTIIRSDRHYLGLLLLNLLSNAVKFTSSGQVTLSYEQNQDGYCICVIDTGIGIHVEHYEQIFNRFEKLDKYTQGTGLGLSLCRSITERLGGKIELDSKVGVGTTFRVRFSNV